MELEEQKPKDILLDREIKTEPADLLENVKEKLLEEEDYFELLVPKQETEYSLENVKEEPIDEDGYSELIIPKQETAELFENVKQEPIDEEDYSELLVSKHEEVIEPSASHMSNNPVQKSFIETLEDVPKVDIEPQIKTWKRCLVCLHLHTTITMKYVSMEGDKLVVMVGFVLRGDFSIDRARSFMSGRSMYICYFHFSEAINEIYKVLSLNNIAELTSRSSDLVDNLMVTVNTIYPHIETLRFSEILHDFVRRNISRKRKSIKTGAEQSEKQIKSRCSVCTQEKRYINMKQVSLQNEKLVIMLGCIIRGEYTLEEAQSFISLNESPLICHIHFSEALSAIHKALDIKHLDEVSARSNELLANLMVTVSKLYPNVCNFRTTLKNIFTRNKHLL